jgi:hypothetical protein
MLAAPKPVWRWPPAMFSMGDLFVAMRAGFDLHVEYNERGNAVYRLSRAGIAAPIGILQQTIAHRAYTNGRFERGEKLPNGQHQLTLKPRARRVRS